MDKKMSTRSVGWTLLTPTIVRALFWVGLVCCLGYGLFTMVAALRTHGDNDVSLGVFVGGLATALVGPLVLRVAAEAVLVVFMIHDRLDEATDLLRVIAAGRR